MDDRATIRYRNFNFGPALQVRAIRKRLGWTQTRMAKKLHVSFATINRWENGWTTPSALAWQQILALVPKEQLELDLTMDRTPQPELEIVPFGAQQELEILRLGIQRVAEMTGDPEVTAAIPASVQTTRGWNRLCAFLVGWVEKHRTE
jgi:DNA-binding XRE family transcriptional regulator